MKNPIVISVGGSLIFPEQIDTNFLKQFKRLIIGQIKLGQRFVLVTGGGKICRDYNHALNAISRPKPADLDWLGINATWLNAKLVQLMFGKLAHKEVVNDPTKKLNFKEPILVAGGWKPGRSSDGAMVKYAQVYGAKTIINLSNVDFVYTKDPRKFKDAKKLTNITWKELLKTTGKKWDPGTNVPFDPTAAQFAKQHKLKVVIANGHNFSNIKKILNQQEFVGTSIV